MNECKVYATVILRIHIKQHYVVQRSPLQQTATNRCKWH